MLDLNTLRIGKVLEIFDMLAYDSAKLYISQMPTKKDVYFQTKVSSGLQF
jgi:hypothetical protein